MKIISQKTLASGLRVSVSMDGEEIISGLEERFQKALEDGIIAGGSEMLSTWSDTARRSMKSSRSYVSALQEGNEPKYKGNPLEYNITQAQRTRDGRKSIAIILEEGIEPFDMKEKILKGRKSVKVRFEYGSPTQSHSRKLSNEIHKVALRYNKFQDEALKHKQVEEMYGEEAADKLNPRNTKHFTALTSSPMRGKGGYMTNPSKFGNPYSFPLDNAIKGVGWKQDWARTVKYQWKTREFTGMKGETTKSGKEVAVHTYAVYRTISKKSAADSWVHPGIRPKKILETAGNIAVPKIKMLLETSIQSAIESKN